MLLPVLRPPKPVGFCPAASVGPVTRRATRRGLPKYRQLVGTASTAHLNFEQVPVALDALEMTAYLCPWTGRPRPGCPSKP